MTGRGPVRALATARLISMVGGNAAFVALTLAVYQQTGSDLWLSATMLLTIGLGGVLAPFLGHFGDRFPRKRVMIASDLVAAALFASLTLVLDDLAVLMPLAFLAAVAEVPMISASGAAIPNLVGEDDLAWANGLMLLSEALSVMVGPALGGFLADHWGAERVLLLNAGSFVLSAGIVATVHGRFEESAGDEEEAEGAFGGIAGGLRYLWRDRPLLLVVMASSVLWFSSGVSLPADVPLAELFDVSSTGSTYGAIIAAGGLGGVIGSIASRRVTAATELPVFAAATFGIGGGLILAGLSPWLVGVLACIFVAGCASAFTEVTATAIVQRAAPDRVRARALGSLNGFQAVFFAGSFVVAGVLLDAVGPRATFVIAGLLALPAAPIVWAAAGRRLRTVPTPELEEAT